MSKFFALCLSEHNRWGYILTPYMAKTVPGKDYLLVEDRISPDNSTVYAPEINAGQQKILQWIDQYSDKELTRVFRRKTTVRDFLQSLTDDSIAGEIRPYIERRLSHCIELIHSSNTRLFLKDSPERIYLDKEIFYTETPAEAIFNFHYNVHEGLRYFLSVFYENREIKLKNKRLIPVVDQPSVMVLDNLLLRFKDINSKKLLPFVTKDYIAVPKQAEEKYFNTFVLESIRKYRVKVKGFVLESEPAVPVPVISLEKDLRYRPVLILRMDYGNGRKLYEVAFPAETEANIVKTGSRYTVKLFKRNTDAEADYLNFMQQCGFFYAGNSMFYPDRESSKSTEMDDQQALESMVECLNRVSDKLQEKGFRIDQHFLPGKYFTGSVRLKIELKTETKTDWFDVHAVVHFGGFKIPFIAFRDHIIRKDRNYKLPNGEILILPAEWLAKYSQVMLVAENDKEMLHVHKRYFTVMEDTFEGIDLKYRSSLTGLCRIQALKSHIPSPAVRAVLRPYQSQGISWMYALHEHHLGGCLADDMGLGKTLQVLSLLQTLADLNEEDAKDNEKAADRYPPENDFTRNTQYIQLSLFDTQNNIPEKNRTVTSPEKAEMAINERKKTGNPASLIVMPSSLVHNWVNEARRFTPQLKILPYINADRRENTGFDKYHIVLTTYGILRNDLDILKKYEFFYLILDEAQYVKNPESASYQAALQINANHYLSLSGTPVENSLTDLWSQMNFLNRGLLGNLNFFREHFAQPIEKDDDPFSRQKLQRLVQPFLLRRTKKEVIPDLPDLTEQIRYCEMTETQRSLYEEEKSRARNEVLESIQEQGVEKSGILIFHALNKLRQLAIHPAMLDENYAFDSGKFEAIIEDMNNLHEEGHKVLLFSSYTKHLGLIAAHLDKQNVVYSLLTGKTRNREEIISRFNDDPDIPFFLISLKAGGVGLNLTAADYVFLLDPWWNPASEQQAISRAHRIGQKKKVFAYRMITTDTIEEKILQLQEKKSALAGLFAQSDNPFRHLSEENVMELFA